MPRIAKFSNEGPEGKEEGAVPIRNSGSIATTARNATMVLNVRRLKLCVSKMSEERKNQRLSFKEKYELIEEFKSDVSKQSKLSKYRMFVH